MIEGTVPRSVSSEHDYCYFSFLCLKIDEMREREIGRGRERARERERERERGGGNKPICLDRKILKKTYNML